MIATLLVGIAVAGAQSSPLDIIGYYGNSGDAVSSIPLLKDVHPNYNVIILTFASLDSAGNVSLDIQGPYAKDHASLSADVVAWRKVPDAHGRRRRVLVSIGGQNGRWPAGLSSEAILSGVTAFLGRFSLDGLDIDLEGSAVSAATSLVPVVTKLVSRGVTVTAAPEAAQGPLVAYNHGLLKALSWVHPQFYNNGPNAVTTPYVPPASLWPTPWTVHNWQAESAGHSFWAGVLAAIGDAAGLAPSQLGMLVPATPGAASSYNNWDIDLLRQQVQAANVTHVGTWAIAYDHKQSWKLAETLGKLLSTASTHTTTSTTAAARAHECGASSVFDCLGYTDCRVCVNAMEGNDVCVTTEEAKGYARCVTAW